jgi:hypothetical protein
MVQNSGPNGLSAPSRSYTYGKRLIAQGEGCSTTSQNDNDSPHWHRTRNSSQRIINDNMYSNTRIAFTLLTLLHPPFFFILSTNYNTLWCVFAVLNKRYVYVLLRSTRCVLSCWAVVVGDYQLLSTTLYIEISLRDRESIVYVESRRSSLSTYRESLFQQSCELCTSRKPANVQHTREIYM